MNTSQHRPGIKWITLAILVGLLSACGTTQAVRPWEKGNLAKKEMTFEGDPLNAKFAEHIYTSKEAAAKGAAVGGGGCGCN
jgi:hypothetical protein